jgi:hypothetical protein
MEDEKENRIDIKDLPQAEQELTAEESKKVPGGANGGISKLGSKLLVIQGDSNPVGSEPVIGVFNSAGQRLASNDDIA